MSDTSDTRLIRCPNCEKLLPEVIHFSVYECGNCGAVIKGKNQGADMDTFSDRSDEESIRETVEKLSDRYDKMVNISERRKIDIGDDSGSDMRSSISTSSRGRRRILRDENNLPGLRSEEERWDIEGEVIRDRRSVGFQRAKLGQGQEDIMMYRKNEVGLRHAARMLEGQNGKKTEVEGFMRAQRRDVMVMKQEGLSDHVSRSDYESKSPARIRNNVNRFGKDEHIGEDRAVLRQFEMMKDKHSWSGDLIDKGKEKVPRDRRRMGPHDPYASEDWYPDVSLEQNSYPNRSPYQNYYSESPPSMHRQEMGRHGFYHPPQNAPNHVRGYGGPSRTHMYRRDLRPAPVYYHASMPRAHVSGPYQDDGMDFMDAVEPYPLKFNCHHPSCSCYQCLNQGEVYAPMRPTAYSDKYSDPGSFGSRDYNGGFSDGPPLRSQNSRSHSRWSSDVESEVNVYTHSRPPRVQLASGEKGCSPIAGGAPFFICLNCSELLLLSMKVFAKSKRNKVRCGACSTLIVLTISEKSLVVSIDLPAEENPIKVESKPAIQPENGNEHQNQVKMTLSSDDYDDSGYDYHYMDREPGQISAGQESANEPLEMKTRHSTSSHAIKAEDDWESLSAARKDSSLADQSRNSKGSPLQAGSSLHDHFEYSDKFHVASRLEKGKLSGHTEHEKALQNKAAPRELSREVSSATEIDLSSNEFNNTGTTIDSGEAGRGGNLKAKSFFAGIIEENFKDERSDECLEQERANVTVNGHLIPERLIKKAERLAGTIKPGNYWYDFRAGFWGAIGGPCLGIIPPFIEEFNYPMPEHCAGGNTQVFVNGRELNQKDLNLLAVRGLPKERDRSYIVEVSGRVLDGMTGEDLESLGKLAPTVERNRRGFGMTAPKAAAT